MGANLAKNLKWWDSSIVSVEDKNYFVTETLSAFGKPKVETKNNTTTVSWTSKPKFGPYLFNKKPFKVKANNSFGYKCVGKYVPVSISRKLIHLKSPSSTDVFISTEKTKLGSEDKIQFILGGHFSNTPWTRLPDKSVSCKKSMSLPIISLIDWNNDIFPSKEKFRIASTNLLPRGNILRSGSGYMGTLVTYPNIKAHPGYNKSVRIRPYTIKHAKKALNSYKGETITLRSDSISPYIKRL